MSASVYFIQAGGRSGPVKIGFTNNVAKRIEQLKTSNHAALELLFSMETDAPREYEARFHRMFADLRQRGEWFRWHQDIDETIELLKRMDRDFSGKTISVSFEMIRIPGGGVRIVPKGKGKRAADRLAKFTPTVAMFLNIPSVDLQERAYLFKVAGEITKLVDRREGVVVCDMATSEIWRGIRGADLVTGTRLETTLDGTAATYVGPMPTDVDLLRKHCIECGVELSDEVQRTTEITPDSGTNRRVTVHFCADHPSSEIR